MNGSSKEINKRRKIEKTERLIKEAIACCQDILNAENCDYTQAIIDNLRSAAYRCSQKKELMNKKIYK